jgi:hypothetical protein
VNLLIVLWNVQKKKPKKKMQKKNKIKGPAWGPRLLSGLDMRACPSFIFLDKSSVSVSPNARTRDLMLVT